MNQEEILDLINQGVTFMKLEKYEDAKELFRKAVDSEPKCIDAYMHLGNSLVNLGEMDEAINAFKNVLIIDNGNGEAFFSIANVYYLKDERKDAVKYYVKAENAGYHTADMYLIMANIFYDTGDTVGALRYISKALKEQPLSGELWRQKVLLELELGNVDEAMDSLDEFESLLPDALDVHELRTRILTERGEYDKAREHLERALAMFPEDIRLLLLSIHLDVVSGKHDDAKTKIAVAKGLQIDAASKKRIALEESGIYVKERNVDKIIESIKWGLEAVSDDADLLFIMLQTYIASLDYEHIIEFADQLLNLEHVDPSVTACAEFYRALSLRETGKKEEATVLFRGLTKSLRKMTIDNPESLDIFMYRLLAHTALGEYDKAFELADYLGKVSPNPSDVHAMRSLIYRGMGNEEKAREELTAAHKADGSVWG